MTQAMCCIQSIVDRVNLSSLFPCESGGFLKYFWEKEDSVLYKPGLSHIIDIIIRKDLRLKIWECHGEEHCLSVPTEGKEGQIIELGRKL